MKAISESLEGRELYNGFEKAKELGLGRRRIFPAELSACIWLEPIARRGP